ncbi:MAG: hypothetical protein Q7R79_03330, partial [bacterium]|nr:hypothetical protein [bacterium]
MTRGELLNFLTEESKKYRQTALSSLERNGHMNDLSKEDISKLNTDGQLIQRVVDALLVDFINFVGVNQCVDYGLYTKDLSEEVTMEAKMILHHDDPPCTARLHNGFCRECNFIPDMQSTCFYFYCPTCDIPLKNL